MDKKLYNSIAFFGLKEDTLGQEWAKVEDERETDVEREWK